MRKNILVLFVSLVMSITLGFAFNVSLAQTVADQQTQSKVEQEATRQYKNLSSLSMSDRRAFFKGLTPELKGELWKIHLRSYVSENSDLTDKQREAIRSAIALITPQLFEIPQDSPDWQAKVNEPLQRLTKKFLEVFPREIARKLLTFLGGAEPKQESNSVLIKKNLPTFKPISCNVAMAACGCSTRSDWCRGEEECVGGGCDASSWGCGTMWAYSCNGECAVVLYPIE